MVFGLGSPSHFHSWCYLLTHGWLTPSYAVSEPLGSVFVGATVRPLSLNSRASGSPHLPRLYTQWGSSCDAAVISLAAAEVPSPTATSAEGDASAPLQGNSPWKTEAGCCPPGARCCWSGEGKPSVMLRWPLILKHPALGHRAGQDWKLKA